MKKIIKSEKGITLLVLVVTIIILLILASITIKLIVGDEGILEKAQIAKNEWEDSIQREDKNLKDLANIMNNNTIGGNTETTPENPNIPEIDIDNIKFEQTPKAWTNKSVIVKTSIMMEIPIGYKLQTSKDEINWTDELSQMFEENGIIYVRLYNGNNETNHINKEIRNIDKKRPEVEEVIVNTSSATICGEDEMSGIIGYAITIDSNEPTQFIECEDIKKIQVKVDNLRKQTTYYAWIKDKAGNISLPKSFTTMNLEDLTEANTYFTYSNENWTNEDVRVTAFTTVEIPEGYRIQTSKDSNVWSDELSQTFETNGTIYARLYNGIEESGYAVAGVTKIDKEKPIVTAANATQTTIAITATDESSGIIGYTVTTSASIPSSFIAVTNTKSLSITKTGLSSGTTYYVWVKDEAGNISEYKQATTTKYTVIYYINNNNTQTQQYKSGENVLSPSFTPSISGWIFIGWRENNTATSSVLSSKTMGNSNMTLYAVFRQTITLSYNANGGSSTPAKQIGYKYYNNGNTSNPSFTLAAEISRSGYNFKSWRLNSISGTSYNANTRITLTSNTIVYAEWESNLFEITGDVTYSATTGNVTLFQNYLSASTIPKKTGSSNEYIEWYGAGAAIKAKKDCKVIVRYKLTSTNKDTFSSYVGMHMYINNRSYSQLDFQELEPNQTVSYGEFGYSSYNLKQGDIMEVVAIIQGGSNPICKRSHSGTIKFEAKSN